LTPEIENATMSSMDAHNTMSTQALNSGMVREGLRDILLGHAGLYELLRAQVAADRSQV
jgi:type I restriction enzyme R subunit